MTLPLHVPTLGFPCLSLFPACPHLPETCLCHPLLPACTISHVLPVPIPLVLSVPCDHRVRDVGTALCTPRVLTPTTVHPTIHRCTYTAPLQMQS